MEKTLLKLHVESPGTIYKNSNGDSAPSVAGHVWMEIVDPVGGSRAAGFAPLDPKGGVMSVPGRIYKDDEAAYSGAPAFTATFQITEEQSRALSRYISAPKEQGFDKDHYHALTNSCVDFVWKGLQQIGMNPTAYEGHTMPMANRDDFSLLKNPQIPGGGLISIATKDPIPVVAEPMMSPFNDWWGAAPAPWVSVSHIHVDDAHLPQGTITVGPLSPPIPVQQDGSNYADGTGYQ
nr:hypothetical protein [Herbaspirillum sp. ASV7]